MLTYWNVKTHQINPKDVLIFVIKMKVLDLFTSNLYYSLSELTIMGSFLGFRFWEGWIGEAAVVVMVSPSKEVHLANDLSAHSVHIVHSVQKGIQVWFKTSSTSGDLLTCY